MLKLGSVEKETAACRRAWRGRRHPVYGIHLHHAFPLERVFGPIGARIKYILTAKPARQRTLRLRLMRPVPFAKMPVDWDDRVRETHEELCPAGKDCPWNGRTIFAGRYKGLAKAKALR